MAAAYIGGSGELVLKYFSKIVQLFSYGASLERFR